MPTQHELETRIAQLVTERAMLVTALDNACEALETIVSIAAPDSADQLVKQLRSLIENYKTAASEVDIRRALSDAAEKMLCEIRDRNATKPRFNLDDPDPDDGTAGGDLDPFTPRNQG